MLRSASKASNPAVGWAQLLSFAGGSPFGLGVLNTLSCKNIRWHGGIIIPLTNQYDMYNENDRAKLSFAHLEEIYS